MTRTPSSARTTSREIRWLLAVGLMTVAAVLTALLGHARPKASAPPSLAASAPSAAPSAPSAPTDRDGHRGTLGAADGVVPEGVTVFDDRVPAVAGLDPDLRKALRRAATAAADAGVEFHVNSGRRSPAYQSHLLREAVARYGSAQEAARWVATPATSPHVSGDAVDIGGSGAAAWLSRHGAEYGLCQIYRNEPWHYELRTGAIGLRCPPMYADPTQDPRNQQ
jgi:hypothetical protein